MSKDQQEVKNIHPSILNKITSREFCMEMNKLVAVDCSCSKMLENAKMHWIPE